MSLNILVVDDSETTRAIIKKTLGIAGIEYDEFHEVANGADALARLAESWIDLVIADINMPVMGGIEMVERMAQDDLLKTVPVVIVSTEGSKQRVAQLMEKGIAAYLRKPFTPEQIGETISKVLGERHV